LKEPRQNAWTVKQVADYLGLDERTVRSGAADTRDIPRIKLGRSVRFDPDDVIAWRDKKRSYSVARIDRRLKKAS
jgi:excisionase family DNA binding protein